MGSDTIFCSDRQLGIFFIKKVLRFAEDFFYAVLSRFAE